MEYIGYILAAMVGAWAGWHLKGIIILYKLSQDPEHMIQILNKIKDLNNAESDEEIAHIVQTNEAVVLEIERVGNQLYAYSKDTHTFVAQGPSLKDLLESAQKRFPNREFIGNISADNPAKELAQ
jgi:phosphoribosylaminoimidazole carboxylase (NCAIR synthetase)